MNNVIVRYSHRDGTELTIRRSSYNINFELEVFNRDLHPYYQFSGLSTLDWGFDNGENPNDPSGTYRRPWTDEEWAAAVEKNAVALIKKVFPQYKEAA